VSFSIHPIPGSTQGLEDRLRRLLRAFLELSAIFGAFLYAIGWLFAARFFDEFGAHPEEAGINAAWLIIRASFGAIPAAGIVLLFIAIGELRQYVPRRAFLMSCGAAFISMTCFAFLALRDGGFETEDAFEAVSYLSFVTAVAAIISWPSNRTWKSAGAGIVAALIFLSSVVAWTYDFARDYANRVRQGQSIRIETGPNVTIFRTQSVTVYSASNEQPLFEERSLLLGSANGTTLASAFHEGVGGDATAYARSPLSRENAAV
jgi:hypothetical protein